MAELNHAKIINGLEKMSAESPENFIFDFLHVLETPKATLRRIQEGDKQRAVATIPGDIAVPQKLYFRPVQKGVDVAAAMEEIRALPVVQQHKIRFVLVTDFTTVAAYDSKVDDSTTFDFCDFKTYYEFFLPLTGRYEKPVEYAEHPADVKACEKMGRLYDCIRACNDYGKDDLHTLNVFLTRLLFCFFAEDTGIFPRKNQMSDAIQSLTQKDGSDLDGFFASFFTVLNLPNNAPERKTLSATLQAFPYVNGGLFKEQTPIPQFNTKARRLLLECGAMTWGEISPVIFGSMFQAVMDPERRRSMGAHYTSEKNIFKVVRPLFLDALCEELERILELKAGKKKALKEFHTKLGTLGFLDPACGCGNFLVVSYRELRELELQVLLALKKEEPAKGQALDVKFLSRVNINQFYGIELEEFPVEIARVSMWLMEHVMNVKFGKALGQVIPSIPLHHSAEIVCANALTIPWESVVAPEKLSFILGNPPFAGARMMGAAQKNDLLAVFDGANGAGNLDYVCAWFHKASRLLSKCPTARIAFVATNSICQGEQVALLWKDILARDIKIDFAYRTFKWNNEAKGNAAVFCIIVGFSRSCVDSKKILYTELQQVVAKNINPYLVDGPTVFVEGRNTPLCDVPPLGIGNKPIDNGNYLFTEAQKDEFIAKEPASASYFRPWIGSKELINGYRRYCLWLGECTAAELESMPEAIKRVNAVREFRLSSRSEGTRRIAAKPTRFHVENMPDSEYIAIPKVSSERRMYIPINNYKKDTFASDLVFILQGKDYDFGILTSAMHMAWMRTVCGRLKSDYRYSRDLCYNTFPWPTVTPQQKKHIEALAETVLLTREMYPDMTLAQMYDPDKMPAPLREAHAALDVAVDKLYSAKPFESDEQRLKLLFELYEKLVREKPSTSASQDDHNEPEEDEGDDDA